MHPYHFHQMGRWHRGPSRILWFLIGAGTATWWIKRKDGDRHIFGHCRRVAPPASVEAQPAPWPPQSITDIPRVIANMPPASSEPASPQPVSPGARGMMGEGWDPKRSRYEDHWDIEKEQLAKLSKQAADTMAEITEATLASVMSTAEALKQASIELVRDMRVSTYTPLQKLAEHRAQREQQEKIEKELEEQRRNPPRLV
ncbi:hypothetical protein D9619_006655 [Psilocybe cf. subviscida]|uniref:Uncharacterized protein n=1 Tax=Psilocybe cf. subviscida TaxID=2480587 RepID=A0A8H5B4X5_9AGAR|nr:hypothetical protein D9619_006655 [Psilocybe cf. subviscida]